MKSSEILSKKNIGIVDIPENMSWNMSDVKIGQTIDGVLNYEVVEKTKSYIVLRVINLTRTISKRTY